MGLFVGSEAPRGGFPKRTVCPKVFYMLNNHDFSQFRRNRLFQRFATAVSGRRPTLLMIFDTVAR